MEKSLKVLIIEDSEFDARVMISVLRLGGYKLTSQRVDTESAFRDALGSGDWDVVLSDYNLPDFQAPDALRILRSTGLDIPFIIISGGIGEDVAVAAMKSGAHDYLMKGQLARLVVAVEREMREAQTRRERLQVEDALRESELRNRLLWENSTDAVLLMDGAGLIHFANPATTEIFGYPTAELVGGGMSRLFGESGLAEMQRQMTGEAEGQGSERRLFEAEGHTKKGVAIPLEIATSSLELHQRRMHVAFIRDISERLRAEREIREHKEQFRVARDIQQWMFPKKAPVFPGFDIAGASFPAEAAGGDYFDYVSLMNDRLAMVVADVTGHGIGPALLMAEARAYLRVLSKRRDDVGEILTQANLVLAEDLGLERYITMILVALDSQERSLSWANAGHPLGLVVDASGNRRLQMKRTGPPLGIRSDTQHDAATKVPLQAGDIVVLLTDGFEEALSEEDEFFGTVRICEHVHRNRNLAASEILSGLRDAVNEFVGSQDQADDLTGIIVKVSS
ncbi:MAG: Phosphoserine phosphatase RsbU [Verrucomicrobia subdivision 3 bacterium]|nr:Phosphoserine phosphatase RsbU [Limisphaerales bacterium]MCS1417134.1 Phosphoserine phosphatase RsbU [Limisphaerales bacterium]